MSSWAPHLFSKAAENRNCSAESIQALVKEGNRLHDLGLPVIFTLGHLADICGIPYDLLDKVIKRKTDPYRVFRIRKRSGGYRQICVPEGFLLQVQRWIHTAILCQRPLHSISKAYAPNCDPLRNAGLHVRAKWLVKIDVAGFFESISERQVYKVFRSMGYPAFMSFQLCRLCTRVSNGVQKYRKKRWKTNSGKYKIGAISHLGHLPQGAPSSPMLANLVCLELDKKLAECAAEYGCMVSRYADDIVFSSMSLGREKSAEIIKRASELLGEFGLLRRHGKTQVATPGSRKLVTGLLVDGDSPKLPKEFRQKISLHLFHARTKGISGHCLRRKFRSLIGFRSHLDGLIGYAEHVDPAVGESFRREFDSLPWGDLSAF